MQCIIDKGAVNQQPTLTSSSQLQRFMRIAFAIIVASFQMEKCVSAVTVFDVASDFSIAGNPNSAWSYGYSTTLAGPLILNAESGSYVSGVDYWRTNIGSGDPVSFRNSNQFVSTISSIQLQPGQFAFHPGPNDEYEKARLTVPSSSTYLLTGAFAGADVNGATTDVHILLNGISIFDSTVNGFGPTSGQPFFAQLSLAINDTLDFAVGFGANGYFADSTALAAHVTAAPEPTSFALLGIAGLAVLSIVVLIRIRGIGLLRRSPPNRLHSCCVASEPFAPAATFWHQRRK